MATFEQLTDEQRAALARAGHKLFHNPEVSTAAKRLLMKADSTVRFPEIEAESEINAQLALRDKKIEELQQQQIENDARARLEARRAEARERGLDPEEVERAITERGIGKWETAMEFVELSHRVAPATSDSVDIGNSTALPSGDASKDFWKDPAGWANKQAHAVVDEFTLARRRAR